MIMINKLLLTLFLFGLLGLGIYGYLQSIELQARMDKFMNVGPRFTAKDGQALCERIKALEQVSYGYRDAGKSDLSCDYAKPK